MHQAKSVALISKSFSSLTADNIQKELDKCECWIDIMSKIADWLISQKSETAKDHVNEILGFTNNLAKANDNFLKIMHVYVQGNTIADGEPVQQNNSAKP